MLNEIINNTAPTIHCNPIHATTFYDTQHNSSPQFTTPIPTVHITSFLSDYGSVESTQLKRWIFESFLIWM